MKKTAKKTRGMTLVETLVVMTIIALLASMIGLVVPRVSMRINESATKASMQKLICVLELYRKDCGQYPDAINHDPGRGGDGWTPSKYPDGETNEEPTKPILVPAVEGGGTYPQTINPKLSRPLYSRGYDESVDDQRQYSELVWALGTPMKGWGTPQLFEMFRRNQVNFNAPQDANFKTTIDSAVGGQLVDAWGRRIFYLSSVAYRNTQGKPRSGAVAGTGSKAGFYMPATYQIYSAGGNLRTYADCLNKGGMEDINDKMRGTKQEYDWNLFAKDDINNWATLTE